MLYVYAHVYIHGYNIIYVSRETSIQRPIIVSYNCI